MTTVDTENATGTSATWASLAGRSFLKESDLTVPEWCSLLDLARELKAAKRAGHEQQHLAGKNIALIFEKASTRTRCAFEVAAYDQGAHLTYLDPTGSHIGHKESIRDTDSRLGYPARRMPRERVHSTRRPGPTRFCTPTSRTAHSRSWSSPTATSPQRGPTAPWD